MLEQELIFEKEKPLVCGCSLDGAWEPVTENMIELYYSSENR